MSRSKSCYNRYLNLLALTAPCARLLRKVDFTTYKSDNNHRDAAIIRRYAIQKPQDYTKYNRICGSIRYLSSSFKSLPSRPFPPVQILLLTPPPRYPGRNLILPLLTIITRSKPTRTQSRRSGTHGPHPPEARSPPTRKTLRYGYPRYGRCWWPWEAE